MKNDLLRLLFWLFFLLIVVVAAESNAEAIREVDVHPDSALNVRVGADAEYKSISKLADGAKVLVLEEHKGWALVAWPRYPDNPLGWVSTDYLK